MEFIKRNSGVIATVALIIAIVGVFTPAGKIVQQAVKSFGGVTNYDEVDATAIKVGGSNGSRVGPIISTTCSLIGLDAPAQAASTTKPYDCAVTGVVSGDTVFFAEATTTATYGAANAPFRIVSAKASTTAGYVTFGVFNALGASQVIGNIGGIQTGFGSSTQVLVLHPVTSVPGL